jgi:hypothetical protein
MSCDTNILIYTPSTPPILKLPACRVAHVNTVIRHREDLKLLVGTPVKLSGRVKEYRKHPKRRDLDTVLLVSLSVTPMPDGETIWVDHLFFLRRQFLKMGRVPMQGERVFFEGVVYEYTRLGGKSLERKLLGHQDYGVKPLKYT